MDSSAKKTVPRFHMVAAGNGWNVVDRKATTDPVVDRFEGRVSGQAAAEDRVRELNANGPSA